MGNQHVHKVAVATRADLTFHDETDTTNLMEQRLSIVTLGVRDLDRARSFYLDGLGWNEQEQDSDGIVFVQMPGIVFALYPIAALAEDVGVEVPSGPAPGAVTLAYNTRTEAEVDDVLEMAVGAGATLVKAAEKVFWGGYSGYFADPDGHLWEVAFNPFSTIAEDGSMQGV